MLYRNSPYLNMKRIFEYKIDEKYAGRDIKYVLKNKFLMSNALITELKKTNFGIAVNEKHEFVNYVLKSGDTLKITIQEEASKNIEPVFLPIKILYEDEDFLAVDKSADMPTHTSIGHHTDTLSNAVLYYLNKNGEEHTFHAVTRLDRNTSGVVLIAKNSYAHDLVSNILRCGKIEKTYLAIVCGKLIGEGEINAKIRRENESIIKRCVASDGQEALTVFKSIKNFKNHTLVELKPKTGRTHQLRVHTAHIGHPIAGDDLYGGDNSAKRQLLHCESLKFMHPIKRKEIKISAELPEDFKTFF